MTWHDMGNTVDHPQDAIILLLLLHEMAFCILINDCFLLFTNGRSDEYCASIV